MSVQNLLSLEYVVNNPWKIACLCVLICVSVPLYRITLHPLAKYPGPISWSISRVPWHWSLHHGQLHLDLYRLHQEYGHVVRIAPNELSYTHPDAYRDIHATRPGHKLIPRNNIWFQRSKREMKQAAGLLEWDEAAHSKLRRAFAGAFTESGVREMSPVVTKHVDLMVKQLTKVVDRASDRGEDGAVADLVEWLNFTTFDISGELSFGDGFGSIEAEKAHPWVEINFHFGKGVAMMTSLNFLWPMNRVFALIIPKKVKKMFAYHKQLTAERVGKRLDDGVKRADFLGAVEKHNEDCLAKGHSEKMVTRDDLNLNMSVIVFASSETTSSALSSIFRYLLQSKEATRKVTEEVRGRFRGREDITFEAISNLNYVDAVIQEGIRLGPSVAINVPRMMPPGGEEICGRHVPAGVLVSVSPYAAFRSPRNFHKPEQFIPERFLPEGKIQGDILTTFQPFSQGRHMCLGYRLAWLMMRVILVQLVYSFDIELTDEVGDFGQQQTFIFWEKDPLQVRLRARQGGI